MKLTRLLSAVCAGMLLSTASLAAFPVFADDAPETFSDDALTYERTGDGVKIVGADEGLVTVHIPDKIGAYPILAIGEYAFSKCKNLREVTIDGGVKTLETGAFSECIGLEKISLGDALETVGDGAFYYCGLLRELTLPDSVREIGPHAFSCCFSLASLAIPEGVAAIPEYAFYYDAALESVFIPDSVTSIGDMAFVRCDALRAAELPASITEISDYAFISCSGVEQISLRGTASDPAFKVEDDGALLTNDGSRLMLYPAAREGSSYTVPDGVTVISAYAFSGAADLKEIRLPESVSSLGEGAFSGCKSLAQFTFPKGLTAIAGTLFAETALTSVVIPDTVTEIGEYAFYRCTGLTSVRIPDSVKTIGSAAFFGCTGLHEVTLPDSVTEIGDTAFGFRSDPDSENTDGVIVQEDFTLRGSSGSAAKKYASDAGVRFRTDGLNGTLVLVLVIAALLLLFAAVTVISLRRRKGAASGKADVPAPEEEYDRNYTSMLAGTEDPYERYDSSTLLGGAEDGTQETEDHPNE
ncbi:MAG: leucine-rich repeat domain-containing protein [Oscillospiraceae bacterium]|nr:leucine-rich repeat domain-containing protein [Oscillospiraceae bacterium]